jgi:hypothetical protein
MSRKSFVQRKRLISLACTIMAKDKPLGVGLKKGCWAGVAVEIARQNNEKMTEYYGLAMNEIKEQIKRNNVAPPEARNRTMIGQTLRMAIS